MQEMKLGAIHRPAPAHIQPLRAFAAMAGFQPPPECRWDQQVDWLGADGQPDALGNDVLGNCVPCSALRLMQLWRDVAGGDQRKPQRSQAVELYTRWAGYNPDLPSTDRGSFTDEAFGQFARKGFVWTFQQQIVPRWTIIEADGIAPNLYNLKVGIAALGGVLATFRMPRSALSTTALWVEPQPGTDDAADAGVHEVLLAAYDSLSTFYGVSWGYVIPIRPAFILARLLQASAFASDAWLDARTSKTPSGLDRDQIRAIGAQIEGV